MPFLQQNHKIIWENEKVCVWFKRIVSEKKNIGPNWIIYMYSNFGNAK